MTRDEFVPRPCRVLASVPLDARADGGAAGSQPLTRVPEGS